MLRKISITEKLFLYYLAICLGTIIIVSSYSYYSARKAIVERTSEQLTSVRVEKTNNIERFFRDRERDIQLLSKSEVISEMFGMLRGKSQIGSENLLLDEEFSKYLRIYLTSNGYYQKIILITPEGGIRYTSVISADPSFRFITGNLENTILPVKTLAEKIRKSGNTLIQDYRFDASGSPKLFIGTAVRLPNSPQIPGVVILEISIDVINSIMYENNSHNGLGKTGESYLVGNDFLLRTASRFQENSLFRTRVNTDATLNAFAGKTGIEIMKDYRGIQVLSSFGKVHIPGLNWVIAAEIDTAEAMIPVFRLRNSILGLSLLVSLLLFGLVYFISRRITSPIILLKHAATRISEGFYNIRLKISSRDEIGELTEAFNKMSEQLEYQSGQIQNERLRRLSSMIDGQEMERQRLSRDLHDSLGQSILAVKIKLEQARSADPVKSRKMIDETRELIRSTIQEIRDISNNLMPPVLEAFGIEQGLKKLCKDTSANTGISIEFISENIENVADSRIQIYLYRIAQEAINNITKHSAATTASVRLTGTENHILLMISDDGKGFNPDEKSSAGNGMTNMKERVELLKGECDIVSLPGAGTEIIIKIPQKHE